MGTDTSVFLTTQEAAKLLRVSVRNIQQMVQSGKLPVRRFGQKGRIWRFLKADLIAPLVTDEPSTHVTIPKASLRQPSDPSPSGRTLVRVKGGGVRYQ